MNASIEAAAIEAAAKAAEAESARIHAINAELPAEIRESYSSEMAEEEDMYAEVTTRRITHSSKRGAVKKSLTTC